MDNAKNLMAGTLNKSFTAANGEKISMQGLKDKAMDYVLVKYEQTKVQASIDQYHKGKPNADMNGIMNSINNAMGSKFAPDAIRQVMNEKFDGANPLILTAMKTGLN